MIRMKERNPAFDALKGIAIIAVVLYHYGGCPYGFLGVDIFLVIAGYFTAKSLFKDTDKTFKSGGGWLFSRIWRILPILLIAEILILCYGFLFMIPWDFDDVSGSIIATNLFSNNIRSKIVLEDYWSTATAYKPLMHTWYLGILMQFYVIFVIVDLVIYKIKGLSAKTYITVWMAISGISLVLYFSEFKATEKFYEIPYRLFEFGTGSLVYYFHYLNRGRRPTLIAVMLTVISFMGILVNLFLWKDEMGRQFRLISTVVYSAVLMYGLNGLQNIGGGKLVRILGIIGAASFSIYVWHQIVFAMARYSLIGHFTDLIPPQSKQAAVAAAAFGIIVLLSFLSYKYLESLRPTRKLVVISGALFAGINLCACIVHKRAGIFYDIPELEISENNIERDKWITYSVSPKVIYEKEFTDSDKPDWLLVGNSYARDFANIISESEVRDDACLSWVRPENVKNENVARLIKEADLVIISTLGLNDELVNDVKSRMSEKSRLIIVGEKNFGYTNGIAFFKRNSPDYLKETAWMENGYEERNRENKIKYGDNYVDLIEMVRQPDGKVTIFTDEGCFISFDCLHLTRRGARYFAERIDWSKFQGN